MGGKDDEDRAPHIGDREPWHPPGRSAADDEDAGRDDEGFGRFRGYMGLGPKNWLAADERIREQICEAMFRDEDLDATEVEVRVDGGEVTLTGTVEDRRQKRLAELVAEAVEGVHDVHNRLRLVGDEMEGTRQTRDEGAVEAGGAGAAPERGRSR